MSSEDNKDEVLLLDVEVDFSGNEYFFVGGYSEVIYLVQSSSAGAASSVIGSFASGNNASFMSLSGHILVAVNELGAFQGTEQTGGITTFTVNNNAGSRIQVRKVNSVPSRGADPCFVTQLHHQKGRSAYVVNYSGGNYGAFALDETSGAIAASPVSFFKEEGKGPHAGRQESSHPHHIITDSQGKFAFVVDLGTDRIHQFKIDPVDGSLAKNSDASVLPGSGPRHLTFHPVNEKLVYVTNELSNTIDLFEFSRDTGHLTFQKKVGDLNPAGEAPAGQVLSAAEITCSSDGSFLYASLRDNINKSNVIIVFKVDQSSGDLELIESQDAGGSFPRHFTMAGKHDSLLIVANQFSNNLVFFERDQSSGKLKFVSELSGLHQPTCVIQIPKLK
eukprot:TRINITY_DN7450_c0_g1_i1.p1 TRINITY_DN7450_c0_g1~~TRINITY_DN7450_c0_g1_i1.p1  ORF type:complete len:406 (+),score=107.61 TRINITY_DN7450_c0_g1_i1:49-1218(+)